MTNAWRKAFRPVRIAGACALFSLGISAVYAATSEREAAYQTAREHLQAGRAKAAYSLLLEKETEWSGEDAYDYLLGVSALDSGEAGEAIFSLQRLVARRPAFAGARMELARAYYDIGDNELARIEFERILTDNPPQNVADAAGEYMKAIEAKARDYQATIQYAFNVGAGYDSNAPAATADDVFLNFRLSPNNLEQSSAFFNTALGATYTRPISPEMQILVTARLDHRANPSTHFVDASNATVGMGWQWKRGGQSIAVTANRVYAWLDRESNKEDTGINLAYNLKLSDSWGLMAFARAGEMRFDERALQIQDIDTLNYGLTVTQTFKGAQLMVTLTGGADDAQQAVSPFSADSYGLRISNNWYRPGKVFFIEANAQNKEYDDPFFGITREDELVGAAFGATFNRFPTKDWSLTFRTSYSEKDSTVSLYSFDRLEVAFSLRRVF